MRLPETGEAFDGRYTIDGVLGEGVSAIVYDATDRAAERRVALKVLRPGGVASDPRARARFMREVRVVAGLRDTHTLKLFSYGECDGLLFMVFEYVPGRDLSEALSDAGKLDPGAVAHVLRQLLLSLREAHQAGVLHRDIKPENVRVFEYAHDPMSVKLLDFGIARVDDDGHPSLTKTGELIGTPRYMSPEQVGGEPLTASSDLYSVGLVALELLLGRDAFSNGRRADDVPDSHLVRIVSQMTRREPARRLQTATAVLAALDRPSAPREALNATRPPPTPPTVTHQTRSQKVGFIGTLALVAVALAANVYFSRRATEPVAPSPARRLPPAAATPPLPSPHPDLGEPDLATRTACGTEPPFVGERSGDTMFGLQSMSWLIHVPTTYDRNERHPIVVLLHQNQETADYFLATSGFREVAQADPFIIVAPRHSDRSGERPIELVQLAIEDVERSFCVDRKRIFVVGHGAGGYLAARLGCYPWVAGIATNSFRQTRGKTFCEDQNPVPHIMLSPLDSPREPVDGGLPCWRSTGPSVESMQKVETIWQKRNSCSGPEKTSFRHAGSTCVEWACDTPFTSCRLNGGHPWPGSKPRPVPTTAVCDGTAPDFPTAKHVWGFFRDAVPVSPDSP